MGCNARETRRDAATVPLDAELIVSFVASHRCMTAARHLVLLLAGTGAFVAPGSFAARRPMKKTVSAGGVAPPPSAKEKLLWSPGVLKQTAASFAVLWLAKQWALSDPRALWYVDGAREAVQGALLRGAHGLEWWAAVWKSNLQPDFNVRVIERFGSNPSALLRELDESNRFSCASRTRREQSIRPKISRIDFDLTELEISEVWPRRPSSLVDFHTGGPRCRC
jgi:hypothetical protein